VLETLTPAAAIISRLKYPKPFTAEEKSALPDVQFSEWHEEQEYLVDHRKLRDVIVLKRYPELLYDDLNAMLAQS
jgi:hypothetical protein